MRELPRAILFDLDDTILSAYGDGEKLWRVVVGEHAAELAPLDPEEIVRAIAGFASEFWADPELHRHWRMRLLESRRHIVHSALAQLRAQPLPEALAVSMADRFSHLRDEQLHVFPGAIETLAELRQRGVLLALVTNGLAELQRGKLTRFDLARYFEHIQIESEHGFGKPEARAYLHAMQALGVAPHETWMVGDDLEWEVAAPQRLGIFAIWHDVKRQGLPAGSPVRPDRTIQTLSELLSDFCVRTRNTSRSFARRDGSVEDVSRRIEVCQTPAETTLRGWE